MKSRIREILALFLQCSGTFFKLNVLSLATTSPTPLSPHLNQSTLPINSPISKRPSKYYRFLTFSIHCVVAELWHLLWWCGSFLGSGIFALLCPDNRQPLSPPFTPPFWYGSGYFPGPTLPKVAQLTCGWGETGVAW